MKVESINIIITWIICYSELNHCHFLWKLTNSLTIFLSLRICSSILNYYQKSKCGNLLLVVLWNEIASSRGSSQWHSIFCHCERNEVKRGSLHEEDCNDRKNGVLGFFYHLRCKVVSKLCNFYNSNICRTISTISKNIYIIIMLFKIHYYNLMFVLINPGFPSRSASWRIAGNDKRA